MTKLGAFESVFRSADKPVYEFGKVEFDRVLVVTDLAESEVYGYLEGLLS